MLSTPSSMDKAVTIIEALSNSENQRGNVPVCSYGYFKLLFSASMTFSLPMSIM
jgi:hypothetical protein